MQIYTDNDGVQKYTEGTIVIDADTNETVYPVLWDFAVHGGEIDLAKVGGYTDSALTYSQAAFDANEAVKASVADAVEAAAIAAKRAAAIELIANGQPSLNEVVAALRVIVLLLIDEINIPRRELMYLRTEGATVALNATAVHAMFAGIANLPDRTIAQAKTAIQNKINAGDAD